MKRIFDLLDFSVKNYDKEVALAGKRSGEWIKYSSVKYKEISENIALGLIGMGVAKGDKILTMSTNCPEWNFVDMGMLMAGAIHVPVFPTIPDAQLKVIISQVNPKVIFASNKFFYNKILKVLGSAQSNINIFTFDSVKNAVHYSEIEESGRKSDNKQLLDEVKSGISEEDVASIIYTSGTTSKPKGVVLTHKNHVSNFLAAAPTLKMNSNFVGLSYLPLCHVYERMINYMYQSLGISIYYAESLATISDNMKDVKPDVIAAVPLFLEKIYSSILKKGNSAKGFRKKIFFWALNHAETYDPGNKSFGKRIKYKIADFFVYRKIRKVLGGNVKRVICGAAALQPKILRTLWAAGIPVHEGYGLTETSPLITVNHFGRVKFGTIGETINGVEVKINIDGEILCKGPNVFTGYYQNSELTKEAIDNEGWFHTLDVGFMDENGFLTITGRKKDIFKTSSGLYVAPEAVESTLKLSPFIENVLIAGANRNFLSALIIPDEEFITSWCFLNGIEEKDFKKMIKLQKVMNEFVLEIEKYNFESPETERILRFLVLEDKWSVDSGEITPSMKLKRSHLLEKYSPILENFYSEN